jgi:lipopolysaccharide/colanic/teichoic acid biosynthesis glycosyltransferase
MPVHATPSLQGRAVETASTTKPRTSARAVVFGLLRDIPRALEHPAFTGAPFNVVAVLPLEEDHDTTSAVTALEQLVLLHGAGTLLAAGPVGHDLMARASDVALLHRCRLVAVMPTEVLAAHQPVVVWEGDSPLVQLSREAHPAWTAWVKRAIDIVGAAMGLLLATPVLLLAIIAIRVESPGPAFFRHWRVGRNGRRFACLKLRTMRANAEEALTRDSALLDAYRRNDYKLPDDLDPRVTRLGRLLRRTSLDEVPQLVNVLRGEMSLVGPRPVIEEELAHYQGTEGVLLSVRPGLTGAWAVAGRHHVAYPRRAELELSYVRRWSLANDASILLRTPRAILDPGTEPL